MIYLRNQESLKIQPTYLYFLWFLRHNYLFIYITNLNF